VLSTEGAIIPAVVYEKKRELCSELGTSVTRCTLRARPSNLGLLKFRAKRLVMKLDTFIFVCRTSFLSVEISTSKQEHRLTNSMELSTTREATRC
jgi:hypothetical protein